MRPSRVFLTWAVLASTAAALSTPERWRFDIEAREALDKRQDPPTGPAASTTLAAPTGPPATTDPAATTDSAATPPAPTSTDAASTSEPTPSPTSDTVAPTSSPLDTTSQVISSPSPTPAQTGSSSSVGLLFTQTTPSSRPVITVTMVPTSSPNDTNVPFVASKFHQLIIALACIAGALLLALIATAVVAFRARADNDLLHDRLSRYEEGFDLPQRGKRDSASSLGGYGRLSLNDPDPDTMRHSRRSMSEGQFKATPAGRRLSGAPMGSGTPPGQRRVTFGGPESMYSAGSSEHSPVLPPTSTRPFPDAHVPAYQPTSIPPPPPEKYRVNSADSAVRRLPMTPRASNTSHDGYTDPYAGGR
ncbi:hypothetical protein FRC10_004926 [Ceratobasidium sp. 414]|nr:hypothetical protein FRC10_004926 [Ceratobasidium sp. 414]